ncbi:MAG: hypothetical protein HOA24_05240 [Candidatus Pacebacteria bacterium]|jgi:hypothetical protein|nr:hypothetical protein [Candidatus Paceibacterota bacterium]MBT4004645.1 hypothetical protein [Candidatus Paceibacterota bacterium]MBT4358354.1 hypothetical protein [Candidatus Paceibacterota bacterium]MBT6899366.1 hypothetical protein [Candidatus Paceibacterota bacterium]MBT7499647.1 hypothetical protein [Candidatus Paceibacterota bacterium]
MNKLKQFLPFIFPSAAIILVVILAFRWYRLRNDQVGKISEFAQGVEIEDLTEAERSSTLSGVKDVKAVELQGDVEETMGEIRYELSDDKVKFSVTATLPQEDGSQYQVWLKEVDGQAVRKAFTLEMLKGGYSGSAAISTETLPFEVVVSKEVVNDNLMEQILLRGVVEVETEL